MLIEYKGIYGYLSIERGEETQFNNLRYHFSVDDPNKWASKSFRNGWWDGRHYVMTKSGKFLRGLSSLITDFSIKNHYKLLFKNSYKDTSIQLLADKADTESLHDITLAPHQRRMVKSLLQNNGGTVEGVTGSGKTESISLLIKILSTKIDRIFILVHRVGLMDQSYNRFKLRCPELSEYCGMLGDGNRPKESDRFIFSTHQSLSSMLGISTASKIIDETVSNLFQNTGAIIIDECHNVSQTSYIKVMEKIPKKCSIFQFSGTPETNDQIRDWTIIGVGGDVCERVRRKELENSGFIAQAIAFLRQF